MAHVAAADEFVFDPFVPGFDEDPAGRSSAD